MKRNTIRLVIVLGTLSIVGIVITQVYWLRHTFDVQEKQLSQSISIALKDVAHSLAKFNNSIMAAPNPVNQMTSNYFVVNVNSEIDAAVLEHYLKTEFSRRNLLTDFEYGIYNCDSEEMAYGNYVRYDKKFILDENTEASELSKFDEFNYYFGVRFPEKSPYLVNQMGIWIFLSLILLMVIVFFGYALFVIMQQRRLSAIQKDFINNMTHEFKTPISTIAISADVLNSPKITETPERLKNYARIIKNENNRLRTQVEKVLQMAKIEKENLELKREILSLHEIAESVRNFDIKLQMKQGDLELDLKAENCQVSADRVHLTNIIYNLLDNAFKYTEKPPHVIIRTRNDDKFIYLSIEDNGIGVKKEFRKRIFKKFFRVPTGDVHDVKGFGLGLNYVMTVVKAHRWKISLESEIGEGSIFTVKIPFISKEKSHSR